jgi:MFS family permease
MTKSVRYRWLVVAVFFCFNGSAWGMTQSSHGVYFGPISKELNLSSGLMSSLFSIFLVLAFSAGAFWGWLADRIPVRLVVFVTGCCLSLGLILGSYSYSVPIFILAYCLLGGFGMAGAFPSCVGTLMRWFSPGSQGLALGISSAGVGVATAVIPPFADRMIVQEDWHYAFFLLGIVMGLMTLVTTVCIKKPSKALSDKEGLIVCQRTRSDASSSDESNRGKSFSIKLMLKDKRFWLLAGMSVSAMSIAQMCWVHLIPRAIDVGIESATAAQLMITLGSFSILGKIGGGYFSDKFGPYPVYSGLLLLQCISLITINTSDHLWMYIGFSALFGMGYGGCIFLPTFASGKIFGMEYFSTIAGILGVSYGVGCILGPVIAGVLFDISHSYNLSFLIAALIGGIGIILCAYLKKTVSIAE